MKNITIYLCSMCMLAITVIALYAAESGSHITAVNWGNDKAYFFKGNEYIRWDIKADRADPGYPKPLYPTWTGLPWKDGIDAAINWGNGKVYLFKGNEYVRWDIKADQVDPGYPKPVDSSTWPGLWN